MSILNYNLVESLDSKLGFPFNQLNCITTLDLREEKYWCVTFKKINIKFIKTTKCVYFGSKILVFYWTFLSCKNYNSVKMLKCNVKKITNNKCIKTTKCAHLGTKSLPIFWQFYYFMGTFMGSSKDNIFLKGLGEY